jgi:hypothetical protein
MMQQNHLASDTAKAVDKYIGLPDIYGSPHPRRDALNTLR